nr:Uncharacterised protein [Klebsiella pneumoniae]
MERKQTRCADDKDIYPGFSNLTEGFLIARAINFRQIVIAIILRMLMSFLILFSDSGINFCPA